MKRISHLLAACVLLLATAGCGETGYYLQSIRGHLAVMAERRPITALLADPQTSPELRRKLETVLEIRRFAVAELRLPDNESFSTYADIGREAVVWSVVAAPVDSLTPVTWCFPFAGCVPYRGYFSQGDADDFAEGLRTGGYDVHVGEVPAYSTLGWFSDPVLNTFIDYPDWLLAEVIVHELAHQQVYVEDDADFNEAFAQTVMEEGGRRWLAAHGSDEQRRQAQLAKERERAFVALVADTRAALLECYGCEPDREAKLACKAAALATMQASYARLRTTWGGYAGYDDWFARDLNNARFVSVATYYRLMPALGRLLARQGGDLDRFYAEVRRLAAQPAAERSRTLSALLEPAG